MTREEFIRHVAALVAGLQVPVSLMPRDRFGAAYEPWEALFRDAVGFGWANKEQLAAHYTKIISQEEENDREGDTQS